MLHILKSTESLSEPSEAYSHNFAIVFSESTCSICSPRADGSYLPDPDYAVRVQELERFEGYREQTYNWMLQVVTFAQVEL